MRGRKILFALVMACGAMMLFARGGIAQVPTPMPTLAPTPTITPTPAITTQLFSCSCSTPGQPVVWAGRVQAPSFFFARQLAERQCLGYLGAQAPSPIIPTPSAAGELGGGGGGGSSQAMANPCSDCACN